MRVRDHITTICKRFCAGETMQAIGADYGVTREYIRQLLAEKNITGKDGGCQLSAKIKREQKRKLRNESYIRKYGMSRQKYMSIRDLKDKCGASPQVRYQQQKRNASFRNIPWQLSFAEWWAIWEPKWHLRGKRANGFVMARYGDTGGYEVGNVKLITLAENTGEQYNYRRHHWCKD